MIKYIFVLSGIATVLLFLEGCSHKENITGVLTNSDTAKNVLELPEEMDKGFETINPSFDNAFEEIYLPGKVEFDPDKVTRVFSLVNGVVTKIYVNQGDFVSKGQVLAEAFSSDLSNAVSDMEKASVQVENCKKNLERVKKLLESNITSSKDLESAERDFEQAVSEYERTKKIVKLYGGSMGSDSPVYKITAPIGGVVIDRGAQIGSQVRNDGSQNLFTIGKADDVWITLALYQDQFDKVKKGDKVNLRFDGLRDSTYSCSVDNVSTEIDPASMTAKVRCKISNLYGNLKPGMYCSGKVFHRTTEGMFIPSTSVFYDSNGKTYVFLKYGKGRYIKHEVATGKKTSNSTEVKGGLTVQDNVVLSQSIFLNEELKLRSN